MNKSETDATVFLREPDNYRVTASSIASVYVRETRIWTRDPACFRALAAALLEGADRLDTLLAPPEAELSSIGDEAAAP